MTLPRCFVQRIGKRAHVGWKRRFTEPCRVYVVLHEMHFYVFLNSECTNKLFCVKNRYLLNGFDIRYFSYIYDYISRL